MTEVTKNESSSERIHERVFKEYKVKKHGRSRNNTENFYVVVERGGKDFMLMHKHRAILDEEIPVADVPVLNIALGLISNDYFVWSFKIQFPDGNEVVFGDYDRGTREPVYEEDLIIIHDRKLEIGDILVFNRLIDDYDVNSVFTVQELSKRQVNVACKLEHKLVVLRHETGKLLHVHPADLIEWIKSKYIQWS